MANDCYFEMKIKGTMEHCQKWYKKMKSYDEFNHFYRMFSVAISDEDGTDDDYYMCIFGDCAWSLESCCRTSGYSNGKDLFAINSKELNIVMEAYSSEPGIGFQEHYIYEYGTCIKEECEDYEEIYYDKEVYKSFEDFKKEFNLPVNLNEDDLDDGSWFGKGGFTSWKFVI